MSAGDSGHSSEPKQAPSAASGFGGLGWVLTGLLTAILLALVVLLFQLDTFEERLILQAQQLRALGEATDRVAGRVERLDSRVQSGGLSVAGGGGARDDYADVKVRHPEVPNFLSPSTFSVSDPDAPQDGVLIKPWASGDPKGFNPIIENAADLASLERYLNSQLARRQAWTDPNLWEGDLAWRVEITDDFKEITVYLRRGVRWHTPPGVDLGDERYAWLSGPHEFTAHDIVFTFDMLMHPQVDNGFAKNYYADLESWEALDDHTLRFRWKKKLYNSIEATLAIAPIPEFLFAYDEQGERLPEETIGLRFNQHWYNNKGYVGVGAYRMLSYEPGVRMVVERNEAYYGDKPPVKRIEYPIYTDPKRGLLMLKSGELSQGGLYPGEYREEILKWQDRPKKEWPKSSPFLNGEVECQRVSNPAFYYIGWNGDRPILRDRRVRRALTHALNRREIIDEIFVGLGQLAVGPFLPSGPYLDPSVKAIPFDLDAAKALLAEAGWTDSDGDGLIDKDLDSTDQDATRTPFEISFLLYAGSTEWTALANVFKEDLLKVGIKLSIVTAEWSLMQKRMEEKDFDAFSGGWGLSWESDPFQIWHSSQADIPKGSNRVGFRDARADELIEQLRVTFDPEERTKMLREVHRIIHREQNYTFFRVAESVFCARDYVKGLRFAKVRPVALSLPWWVESDS